MPNSKIPSPARSLGAISTPRRRKSRGSRSVCSPALSTASGRLTSVIDQFKEKNMDSFALSPMNTRRSVLSDNTDIEEPRRKSWWKNLNENTRDVMEVLVDDKTTEPVNALEDIVDMEILSQEKKNFTLDLPDSSDNESIHSIVLPQRKLFTLKENQPQKKFGELVGARETLAKLHKTNNDKTITAGTKNLFQATKRSKPIFPAALLNISPNKTVADKTKENIAAEPKAPVRNIFGSRPTNKRKNIFADFIASESEDEIPEIQPKVFGFQRNIEQRRISSVSKGKEHSPTSSVTADMELEEWQHLPSSTLVEHQLDEMVASTPVKRARLSILSEAKESEAGTNYTGDKTKQSNKSTPSPPVTRTRLSRQLEDKEPETSTKNTSINKTKQLNKSLPSTPVTRARLSKTMGTKQSEVNISTNINITKTNQSLSKSKTSLKEKSNKSALKDKTVNENANINNEDDDENNFTLEYEQDDQIEDAVNIQGTHDISQPSKQNNLTVVEKSKTKIDVEIIADVLDNKEAETIDGKGTVEQGMEDVQQNHENVTIAEVSSKVPATNTQETNKQELMKKQDRIEDKLKSLIKDKDAPNVSLEKEDAPKRNQEIHNVQVEDSQDLEDDKNKDEKMNEDKQEVSEANEENSDNEDEEANESHVNQEESRELEADSSHAVEETESQDLDADDSEGDEANVSQQEDNEANESQDSDKTHETQEDGEVDQSEEVENDEESEDENVNESQEMEQSDNIQDLDIEQEDEANDNQTSENEEELNESRQENDNQSEEDDEMDDSADDRAIATDELSDEEQEEMAADDDENGERIAEADIHSEEVIEESPNVTHDTTGRNRKKLKSPEVILHDKSNQQDSFTAKGRNTSIRKTKSMYKDFTIRPSLAPPRDSLGLSDGTRDSSAEGSGWDSHRTTRKTLRQTFGKDFTPRKSLRALVMEKAAKQTEHIETLNNVTTKFPQANSTEYPEDSNREDFVVEESDHEISRKTRQTTLENYLQKIKQQNIEKKIKMEEAIRNSLRAPPARDPLNIFKVPTVPARKQKTVATKPKKNIPNIFQSELPPEVIEDMKYKPPKRFQPTKASWITKRLYKYLEKKLEPKYDYKARVRAEKLMETIFYFVKELRRHDVASPDAVEVLKHEMARLNIVKTHFEFYEFFHEFLPREVRVKVVPDIVNNIALPRHGVFSDIMRGNTVQT